MKSINKYIFGSVATAVSATNAKDLIKIKNSKEKKIPIQENNIFKNSIEKQNIADLIHERMHKVFVNEKNRRNLYLQQVFTKNTARRIIENLKMQKYLSSFYGNNNDIRSLIDKNFVKPDFQENLYKAFVEVTRINLDKVYLERWVQSYYVKSGMTINFNKLESFMSKSVNKYFSPFDLTFKMKKYDEALRKHNFKYKESIKKSFQVSLLIENAQKSIAKLMNASQYSFDSEYEKNKILSKDYLLKRFIDFYWENKSNFSYINEYTNEKDLEKLENISLKNQIENFSLKILENFNVKEKHLEHSIIINQINNENIVKKSSLSKRIDEININDFNNIIFVNYDSENIKVEIEYKNLTKISDSQILLSIDISFNWNGEPYTFRDIKIYPTFKKADYTKLVELSSSAQKIKTNILFENASNKNHEFDKTIEWHLKKRSWYIDLAADVKPIDYIFSYKNWNIKSKKWLVDNEKKQLDVEFEAINSLDSKIKKNLKYKLKGFLSQKEKISNYINSFLNRDKWFHPTAKSQIPSKISKFQNQIFNGLNIEFSNWSTDDINGEISFDAKVSKILEKEKLYIVKRIVVSNFKKQTKLKNPVVKVETVKTTTKTNPVVKVETSKTTTKTNPVVKVETSKTTTKTNSIVKRKKRENEVANYFEQIKDTFSDFDIDRLMSFEVKEKYITRKYKIQKRKWEEIAPFNYNHWLLDNNKEYEAGVLNLDYSKFLDEKNKINIEKFNDWYQNIYLNKAGNFDVLKQKKDDVSSIKNLDEKLESIKQQYIIYMQAYMILAPFFDRDVLYGNKTYNLMDFLFKNIEKIDMLRRMETVDGKIQVNSQVFAYQFMKYVVNYCLLNQNSIKENYIFTLVRLQETIWNFFLENITYNFHDKLSKFITFDKSGMSQEKIDLFLEKRETFTASRRSLGTLIAVMIEESTENKLDSNEWFEQASKIKIEYFNDQELENILQDEKIRAINPGIKDFMLGMKLKTQKIMHVFSTTHDLLGLLLVPKLTPDNTSNIKIALTPYMAIITDGSNVEKKLRGDNYLKQVAELNINMMKSLAKTVPGFVLGMAHDILETQNGHVGQIFRYWDEDAFTNNEENKTYPSINNRLRSYAWDNKIIRGNVKLNNNESRWIAIPDRLGGFKDDVQIDPKDISWLKSIIEQNEGKFYLINRSFGIIPGANMHSNSIDNLGLKREVKLSDIFENINNKSEYDFEVEKLSNFNEFLDFYSKISDYLLQNQPPYYGSDINFIKKYLKNLVQVKDEKVIINKFETDNIQNIKRALKYVTGSYVFRATIEKSLPIEIKNTWDLFIDKINQIKWLEIIFNKIQDKLMSPNLPVMLSEDSHSKKSSDFSSVNINENDCSMFHTVFNIWEKAYNYSGFSRRNTVVKRKDADELIKHMKKYFNQDFKSLVDYYSGNNWRLSQQILEIMQAYNKNLRFYIHRSDFLKFFTYSRRTWWKNLLSIVGGVTGGPWVESVSYHENSIFHEFGHYMDYNGLFGRTIPYILDYQPIYKLDGEELMENFISTKSIPRMADKSYHTTLAKECFSSGKNQVELKINGKIIDSKFYKGDEDSLTIKFSKDSKIKTGDLIEITFSPFNGRHGVCRFIQRVTEVEKKDFYKAWGKMDYNPEVYSEFMERFGPIPALTKKPINSQRDVFPKNSSSHELINYFDIADEIRTSPERLENTFSWWETYGSYYRNKAFLDIKIFDYLRKNNLEELRERIGRFTMPSGHFVSINDAQYDDDWDLLKTKAIKNQNGYIDLKDAIKFLSDNAYAINLWGQNSFPRADYQYSIFGFTPITGGAYNNHQVLSLKLILAIFGWDGVQRMFSNTNIDKNISTIRENILKNNKYTDIFGSQKDIVLQDISSNQKLLDNIDMNDYFARIIKNGELKVPTQEINGVKITDLKSMHSWFYQVVLQNSQENNVYSLESQELDNLMKIHFQKGNLSEFQRFFMWLWQVHTNDYRNNGELWNKRNPSDLPINYNYYDRKYNLSKNLNLETNYEKPKESIIEKLLANSESVLHPIVKWYIKIWNYRNSGVKKEVNYGEFLKYNPDLLFKILDSRKGLKEIIHKISGFKNSIESFPEKIKDAYDHFELISNNNLMKIIDKLILEKDSFSDFLDDLSISEDDIQKGINKIIDQIVHAATDSMKHHDVSLFIKNLQKNRKEMIIFQQESFELRKIVKDLLDNKTISTNEFNKINKEINNFVNSKTKNIFPLFNLLVSSIKNDRLNSNETKEIADFSRILNVLSSFDIDNIENFKGTLPLRYQWQLVSNYQKLKNLSLIIINDLLKNIIIGDDIDFVIDKLNEKISEFIVLKTMMLNSISNSDNKINHPMIKKEDIDLIFAIFYSKIENKTNLASSQKLKVHESLQPIFNWYKNYWISLNHDSLDFFEVHKRIIYKLGDFENGFILLMNIITGAGQHGYWKLLNEKPIWFNKRPNQYTITILERSIKNLESKTAEISREFSQLESTDIEKARRIIKEFAMGFVGGLYKRPQRYQNTMDPLIGQLGENDIKSFWGGRLFVLETDASLIPKNQEYFSKFSDISILFKSMFEKRIYSQDEYNKIILELNDIYLSSNKKFDKLIIAALKPLSSNIDFDSNVDILRFIKKLNKINEIEYNNSKIKYELNYVSARDKDFSVWSRGKVAPVSIIGSREKFYQINIFDYTANMIAVENYTFQKSLELLQDIIFQSVNKHNKNSLDNLNNSLEKLSSFISWDINIYGEEKYDEKSNNNLSLISTLNQINKFSRINRVEVCSKINTQNMTRENIEAVYSVIAENYELEKEISKSMQKIINQYSIQKINKLKISEDKKDIEVLKLNNTIYHSLINMFQNNRKNYHKLRIPQKIHEQIFALCLIFDISLSELLNNETAFTENLRQLMAQDNQTDLFTKDQLIIYNKDYYGNWLVNLIAENIDNIHWDSFESKVVFISSLIWGENENLKLKTVMNLISWKNNGPIGSHDLGDNKYSFLDSVTKNTNLFINKINDVSRILKMDDNQKGDLFRNIFDSLYSGTNIKFINWVKKHLNIDTPYYLRSNTSNWEFLDNSFQIIFDSIENRKKLSLVNSLTEEIEKIYN